MNSKSTLPCERRKWELPANHQATPGSRRTSARPFLLSPQPHDRCPEQPTPKARPSELGASVDGPHSPTPANNLQDGRVPNKGQGRGVWREHAPHLHSGGRLVPGRPPCSTDHGATPPGDTGARGAHAGTDGRGRRLLGVDRRATCAAGPSPPRACGSPLPTRRAGGGRSSQTLCSLRSPASVPGEQRFATRVSHAGCDAA